MKYKKIISFLILICCITISIYCKNKNSEVINVINNSNISKKYVYPLGKIVGIKATTDGVLVIGYEDQNIEYIGGIRIGDNIIAINNIKINKIEDVYNILSNLNNNEVEVTIIRNGKYINESIKVYSDGNNKKLGLWVRNKISGIGTITYYDPKESLFTGIGHAITDYDTNKLLNIKQGYIYEPEKLNVEKATSEKVGYLYGDFDFKNPIGEFKHNFNFGITGVYNSKKKKTTQLMEVGSINDIKLGKAYILLEDQNEDIEKYDINIINLSNDKQTTKQITLEVVDDRLIDYTGGIVQGMSGAPIIQNNKIIGALTHVIKSNSKKGYGIFIEEMIKLEDKN